MAVKSQPAPEETWTEVCVVDAARRVGLCLQHVADLLDSWTRKSQSSFPSVLLRTATVSQVSRLNLIFVRDFFNWSLRYCFGLPHSHLPLASSPNKTIRESWRIHSEHLARCWRMVASMLRRNIQERTTLVMQSSLLMRRIFWNFVSWNRSRCFDFPLLKSPCFESVQKGEEDHDSKDHDFGSYGEVEGPLLEPSVCNMNRFSAVAEVFRRWHYSRGWCQRKSLIITSAVACPGACCRMIFVLLHWFASRSFSCRPGYTGLPISGVWWLSGPQSSSAYWNSRTRMMVVFVREKSVGAITKPPVIRKPFLKVIPLVQLIPQFRRVTYKSETGSGADDQIRQDWATLLVFGTWLKTPWRSQKMNVSYFCCLHFLTWNCRTQNM